MNQKEKEENDRNKNTINFDKAKITLKIAYEILGA